MGLFGKREPAYVPVGRGYEITSTGVAMRAALLEGEPSKIVQLVPDCARQDEPNDKLAVHLNEVFDAFSQAHLGDLSPFVRMTCEDPPTFACPQHESKERDQYMDFVCEKLFKGALLMLVLKDEQFFVAAEYQVMLDRFVDTYKWTKMNFNYIRNFSGVDFDVSVGIGKHFHTFDGAVAALISDHNIRKASS